MPKDILPELTGCLFYLLILFNHKIVDKISSLMYNVNGDEK